MKNNTINTINNGKATISNPQGTVKSLVKDITNPHFLFWLGGFVEGEGCVSISVNVNPSFPFGIQLQPIFNVTQHVNGLAILQAFLALFKLGTLNPKSGSPHVWVYVLPAPGGSPFGGAGYKNMLNLVIPFFLDYVLAFGCKIDEFEMFHSICLSLRNQEHTTKEGLIKMVTLVYSVQGKGKWRKRTLEEVISIIEKSSPTK